MHCKRSEDVSLREEVFEGGTSWGWLPRVLEEDFGDEESEREVGEEDESERNAGREV